MPKTASALQAQWKAIAVPGGDRQYGFARFLYSELLRNLITGRAVKLRAFSLFAAVSLLASPAFAQLTASDVRTIINHAVTRAVAVSPNSVIAVVDREGNVL